MENHFLGRQEGEKTELISFSHSKMGLAPKQGSPLLSGLAWVGHRATWGCPGPCGTMHTSTELWAPPSGEAIARITCLNICSDCFLSLKKFLNFAAQPCFYQHVLTGVVQGSQPSGRLPRVPGHFFRVLSPPCLPITARARVLRSF